MTEGGGRRMHVAIPLRWSDIDGYAHVNNAAMLRVLEEARIEAFWAVDDHVETPESVGPAILDARPGANTVSLIARQEVEYLLPIPYQRAPLDIEMWIGAIGGASLELCYEIYSPIGVSPRLLYTKASTTLVLADAATSRARRITDAEREAWGPYLGAPVAFRRR